jgi:hypothetical protein
MADRQRPRNMSNETNEMFTDRARKTRENGQNLQFRADSHWRTNNEFQGHGIHYNTFGIQIPYGSAAYQQAQAISAVLENHGIRPEPTHMVHASIVTTRRQLHLPPHTAGPALIHPKEQRFMTPEEVRSIEGLEKEVKDFLSETKPFDIVLQGLTLMPETLTYRIADTGGYTAMVEDLWKAFPQLADLKIRPIVPGIAPIDGGAIALFQAAYNTGRYPQETLDATLAEIHELGLDEPTGFTVKKIHQLHHSISTDVLIPSTNPGEPQYTSLPAELEGNGFKNEVTAGPLVLESAPSHWIGMPVDVISLGRPLSLSVAP